MFIPLRRLERWLHQHIFKVGWLLTKQLRTTTALYYTFFLPGVILHEFVYWLAAGLLNVRAERTIAWPEAQAIGELRLNFIRLERDVSRFKLAIISTAPFIAGVFTLWAITSRILHVQDFAAILGAGGLDDLPLALELVTSTPDFWLWFYIAFTIANTMMPSNFSDLRGWWTVIVLTGVAAGFLFLIGAGDELLLGALAVPISEGLGALAGTFAVMIALDLVMVSILGVTESVIERVTGDSATFRNGKMITMTREEMKKLREQEAEKKARQRARQAERHSGPPSIYSLPLPIPDVPGKEALAAHEEVLVRRDERSQLRPGSPPPRPQPTIIAGNVVQRPLPTDDSESIRPSRQETERGEQAENEAEPTRRDAAPAGRAAPVPRVTRSADSPEESEPSLPRAIAEGEDEDEDDEGDDGIRYEPAEEIP